MSNDLRQRVLEAARKKLEQREKKGDPLFMTLKEGENRLRILPLEGSEDGLPFREVLSHFPKGLPSFVSPRTFGKTDPIADFGDTLIPAGGGLDKETFKLIKQTFSPQQRVYALVIDRRQEDEGPRFLGFSPKVYDTILKKMVDEEDGVGDISDPETGYDIILTYTPKEKNGGFAKTEVEIARKASPLTKDKELLSKWLTNQPKLDDHLMFKTEDELNEILKKLIASFNQPSEASTSVKESPTAAASKDATAEVSVSADVAKEFEDIFNS